MRRLFPFRYSQMLAGLFLGFFAAICQAEQNWEEIPLPNPSFEEGKILPEQWQAIKGNTVRPSTATVLAWDKEFVRTGKRSLYIRKVSSGPVRWRCQTTTPVTPGEDYQVRFWYRASPAVKGSVAIGVSSGSKGENGKPWEAGRELPVTVFDEWQLFTMDFTAPPGVTSISFSLSNMSDGRSGNAMDLWFDDISLVRKIKP